MQKTPQALLEEQSLLADLCATLMVLTQGTTQEGEAFWAYLCIKPSMAKSFAEARMRGGFMLEEYGTIIESGLGAAPPDNIRQKMQTQFGMRDDYEAILERVIEEMA